MQKIFLLQTTLNNDSLFIECESFLLLLLFYYCYTNILISYIFYYVIIFVDAATDFTIWHLLVDEETAINVF